MTWQPVFSARSGFRPRPAIWTGGRADACRAIRPIIIFCTAQVQPESGARRVTPAHDMPARAIPALVGYAMPAGRVHHAGRQNDASAPARRAQRFDPVSTRIWPASQHCSSQH